MRTVHRLLLAVVMLIAGATVAAAQNTRVAGFAELGNGTIVTQGLPSTTKAQLSLPNASILILDAGTSNVSTIFSDIAGTPKSNPFTPSATTGYWFFYGPMGTHYDVQFSGAGFTTFTLGDMVAPGGGAGGGSITSVGLTVPAFLSVSGSPITSAGTLAVTLSGSALPITSGGTGSTSQNFVDLTTGQSIAGAKSFTTSIGLPTGGGNPFSPPFQVAPFTIHLGVATDIADSASGNHFGISSWIRNSGSSQSVGVFGEGISTGTNSSTFGGNFVGYLNTASATAFTKGAELDMGRQVAGTGQSLGALIAAYGGNGNTAYLWMQTGFAGSEPDFGIMFAKTAGGLQPVKAGGTAIGFSGFPQIGIGTDYSGASYTVAPFKIGINSFPVAQNSGGVNKIIGGIDGFDFMLFQSGGGGMRVINSGNTLTVFRVTDTGDVAYGANTPAQITANQNDYNPGGSSFQRWSSDASRNVTGIGLTVAPVNGQLMTVVNVGVNPIVLQFQNVGSLAANRFLCSTGADITLNANQGADLVYDGVISRWLVFKRN